MIWDLSMSQLQKTQLQKSPNKEPQETSTKKSKKTLTKKEL